jgi:hypothetical protein
MPTDTASKLFAKCDTAVMTKACNVTAEQLSRCKFDLANKHCTVVGDEGFPVGVCAFHPLPEQPTACDDFCRAPQIEQLGADEQPDALSLYASACEDAQLPKCLAVINTDVQKSRASATVHQACREERDCKAAGSACLTKAGADADPRTGTTGECAQPSCSAFSQPLCGPRKLRICPTMIKGLTDTETWAIGATGGAVALIGGAVLKARAAKWKRQEQAELDFRHGTAMQAELIHAGIEASQIHHDIIRRQQADILHRLGIRRQRGRIRGSVQSAERALVAAQRASRGKRGSSELDTTRRSKRRSVDR